MGADQSGDQRAGEGEAALLTGWVMAGVTPKGCLATPPHTQMHVVTLTDVAAYSHAHSPRQPRDTLTYTLTHLDTHRDTLTHLDTQRDTHTHLDTQRHTLT